ncbi:hypothetical protein NMY22_g14105 [Coprinellus aureogranulatus]|nr:hypothetical protein NMY22_g14105 [Coprinellus aureogranulatus]
MPPELRPRKPSQLQTVSNAASLQRKRKRESDDTHSTSSTTSKRTQISTSESGPARAGTFRNKGQGTHPTSRDSRDHHWVRTLGSDGTYQLAGENLLKQPLVVVPTHDHAALKTMFTELRGLKDIVTRVNYRLMGELIPLAANNAESYEQIHYFTTVHGHSTAFLDIVRKLKQIAINHGVRGDSQRFGSSSNWWSLGRKAPEHVIKIRDIAALRRKALNEIKDAGEACRKTATWVPVERLSQKEIDELANKHLVETQELADIGFGSGVLEDVDGKANYVLLPEKGYHRICAPSEGQTRRATGVILWERANPKDELEMPTGDKIIGAIVYSPEFISKAFSPDQEYKETEVLINQDLLLEKANVDRRRLINGGKMAKGMGAQSIYGMPYFMKLPEDRDTTRGNVKIPVHALEAFLTSRHEAFLEGFLPEFSSLRKVRPSHVVNSGGCFGREAHTRLL